MANPTDATTCRVAVVQATPVLFRLEETLAKVGRLTAEAAGQGAQLILFPEAFIPGYPRGLSFGTVVGSRSPAGRDQWLKYWENTLTAPGEAVDLLGGFARRHRVYLAIGVVEKEPGGGTLYCSLLCFGPDGALLLRHRKLKPTGAERIIWGEGRGDDLQIAPTPLGRLGGLICWENYMPLARYALYQQNVQLYLAPTADQRPTWQATLRHIACEGRCFVLGCNQYVERKDYPEPYRETPANGPEVLSRGGSVIFSPLGDALAGPLWDEEGILYAQLDLTETTSGKMDFDPTGHYARPDVFEYRWKYGAG